MKLRRRRKALSRQDKRGLFILVGAGATVVGLLVVSFLVPDEVDYDPETLCPKERDHKNIVVIVDKTDPFTELQSIFLRNEIVGLRDSMEQFDKLTFYVLEKGVPADSKPVFATCKPGSGDKANALYQNPQKIRLRFMRQFGQPLDDLLAGFTKGEESKTSPIMEMIKNVSFREDFARRKGQTELIIFSDMLQHRKGVYSHYTSPANFKTLARTDYYRSIKTSLPKVILVAEAARKLEEQRRLIAALRVASETGQQEMAERLAARNRELAERKADRDALKDQLAGLIAERDELKNQRTRLIADRDQARSEMAKRTANLSRQNRHLERLIANLQPATAAGGGRGLAPCWEDEKGKIVPTFNIVMENAAFRAIPVWPKSFDAKARAAAPIAGIADRTLNVRDFRRLAYQVKQHGRNHPDGSCVYYANIIDQTTKKQTYKSQRRLIEGYFYPYSLR